MRTEELLEALGGLDEKYIEESEAGIEILATNLQEANEVENEVEDSSNIIKIEKLRYKKAKRFLMPLAACICLVLIARFTLPLLLTNLGAKGDSASYDMAEEAAIESESNKDEKEAVFGLDAADSYPKEGYVNLYGTVYGIASEPDLMAAGLDLESTDEKLSEYKGDYLGTIESYVDQTQDDFADKDMITTSQKEWVGAELYTFAEKEDLLLLFQNGQGIVLIKKYNP